MSNVKRGVHDTSNKGKGSGPADSSHKSKRQVWCDYCGRAGHGTHDCHWRKAVKKKQASYVPVSKQAPVDTRNEDVKKDESQGSSVNVRGDSATEKDSVVTAVTTTEVIPKDPTPVTDVVKEPVTLDVPKNNTTHVAHKPPVQHSGPKGNKSLGEVKLLSQLTELTAQEAGARDALKEMRKDLTENQAMIVALEKGKDDLEEKYNKTVDKLEKFNRDISIELEGRCMGAEVNFGRSIKQVWWWSWMMTAIYCFVVSFGVLAFVVNMTDQNQYFRMCQRSLFYDRNRMVPVNGSHVMGIDYCFFVHVLVRPVSFFVWLLLIALRVPFHMRLPHKREFTLKVLELDQREFPDLRPDVLSFGELKHKDPLLARVVIVRNWRRFYDRYSKTQLVSLELLAQLMTPKTAPLDSDPATVWKRMNFSAASFHSVNVDRYSVLDRDYVVQNTVKMAYIYYLDMIRSKEVPAFL